MILLVGASASGKTALSLLLRKEYALSKAITHTTRSPREGERNGIDYFFVTEEEFMTIEQNDGFVETTLYNGNHYGSSKSQVEDDKVLIVDPNGLSAYKKLHNPSVVAFFLDTSEETRKTRMIERKDRPEDIEKRLTNDRKVFAQEEVSGCDFRIINDGRDLKDIADEVYAKYIETLKNRGIRPNLHIQ